MMMEGDGKPSSPIFHAVWRYNKVFVDEENSIKKLLYKGFGAKDFSTTDRVGPLVLMDEEALYLLQQGMLTITSSVSLTAHAFYSHCLASNADFPLHYKVFCHFKHLGGINYGVHFALYRTFPRLCHAEFCVMIVNNTSYSDVTTPSQIAYQSLSALTRVMPVVMKSLLIAHVANNSCHSGDRSINSVPLEELADWTITTVTTMVRRKEMRNKQGTPSSLQQIHERIHNSCKSKKKRNVEEKSEIRSENETTSEMPKQKKVDMSAIAANIVYCDSLNCR